MGVRIKLICAPESSKAFPIFCRLPEPRRSTCMIGNKALWLLVGEAIVATAD